jgi:hypothetical protein
VAAAARDSDPQECPTPRAVAFIMKNFILVTAILLLVAAGALVYALH